MSLSLCAYFGSALRSAPDVYQRASRLFHLDIWNIGVVRQTAEDIVRRGLVVPPTWLPRLPKGQYLADPSCRINEDGSCRLFAEMLDHNKGELGEIWCADVAPGEDLVRARFRPLLKFSYHASYAFPFSDGTRRKLLTLETSEIGAALLFEDQERPQLIGPLISGYGVVDPTLWQQDGHWFLFCCLREHNPEDGLFLFSSASLTGPWTPHPRNPVRRGLQGSRPAGPLFRADGKLIRPGQDCSQEYGGAVVLHEVTRLDQRDYQEIVVRRLDPYPGQYDAGLHTIWPAGDATLIDGKSWQLGVATTFQRLCRSMFSRVRHFGTAGSLLLTWVFCSAFSIPLAA